MSTTIAAVRDKMAEAITVGTGLRTQAYQLSSLPHPVAVISPLTYSPQYVLGKGKAEYPFRITVVVGPASEVHAQKRCDVLREPDGDGSIVAAIENSDLWGTTTVDYVSVTQVGEVGETVVADETLLAFEIDVTIVW